MASITASSSSRSSANHRLFRERNLSSANIFFLNANDPAPAQINELRAKLINMEGVDTPNAGDRYMLNLAMSLETLQFQAGPERARFEACVPLARQAQLALNKHRFAAVESKWMKVNETLLQLLVKDDAFEYTWVGLAVRALLTMAHNTTLA